MPLTKVETHNIDNYAVSTEKLSNTAVAAFAQTLTPKILTVVETDDTYTALDDTAMNTAGGYLVITGSDFQSGASVLIDTSTANSTTFVNSSTLRAQVPAKASGTYNVYVVNPDGGTAIRVNALTYSAFPAFSTGASLSNQTTNAAFSVAISASSDSNITYANTTALPAGTTLLSNGYFYGTVSVGVETTYSFTVKATDIELQDTSRTFSLTVALNPPERIYAVGNNGNRQLSTGDNLSRSSPTQVGALTDWNIMAAGVGTTHAIKLNGTLWGWGGNTYGLIGNNDYNTSPSSPVQIGSNTNWSKIGTGQQHIVAIRTDGTMWSWGNNQYGQLGLNDLNVTRSSPTQIGSGTTWLNVAVGTYSAFGVKTDGTLWAWGNNSSGELALLDRVNRSSPIQVGALTNWGSVAWGGRITMKGANILAVKTDGTLWTTGQGGAGTNGTNNVINRSSPIQVGALTDWNYPMLGGQLSYCVAMCTKTNGSLWSWGYGGNGSAGTNTNINRSSPIQVGALTNWAQGLNKIHCGWGSPAIAAVKTDGTLWTWGANDFGQQGRNFGNVNSSSPVQVGTNTNWNKVNYGYLHGFFQTYN